MNNISKMNDARLEKLWNTKYKFSSGIMTLRKFFELNPPINKKIYIKKYSDHRIHSEYKEYDTPKILYYVFYTDQKCIEVPKMIYESLDVPEIK
jgi:hypothetical protein